jgi:hypothetical protein
LRFFWQFTFQKAGQNFTNGLLHSFDTFSLLQYLYLKITIKGKKQSSETTGHKKTAQSGGLKF